MIDELWSVRNNQVQTKAQIQKEQARAERDEYALVLQQ